MVKRINERLAQYRNDRAEILRLIIRIRDNLPSMRSGYAIHETEINLRFLRDQLVWLRRNRKEWQSVGDARRRPNH